jgi:glycosyltransferase involved in cell wall biosynthesis
MHIVISIHHFPPHYYGGAELRALRTAQALQARGHTVQVICVEKVKPASPGALTWEDDLYEGVPVRRFALDLNIHPSRLAWLYENPDLEEHLQSFLQDPKPDIFHQISGYLITASGLRTAHRLGIPTVVTLTDFWFLCPRIQLIRSNGKISELPIRPVNCVRCLAEERRSYRYLGRYLPPLMQAYWGQHKRQIQAVQTRLDVLSQALNETNAVISPSQFLKSVYTQAGVQPDRIIFSRQGRDFPGLTGEPLQKQTSTALQVGYLGTIAEIKGVHVLFEAIAQIPGTGIAGHAFGDTTTFPAYTARLQRLVSADQRLRLAGMYQDNNLSQVMNTLDVVVVPSLWYENSPNVILEAFAHHIPVIASNLGGMAELVEHGKNGLLFAPGDASDLANQLRRLVDEPQLLSQLRDGIGPVKTVAQEMDELEAIYQQVAAVKA